MNKRVSLRQIIALGAVCALVVVSLVLSWIWLNQRNAPPPTPTFVPLALTLTPPPSLQALATRYPQLAGTLNDAELDSAYKDFLVAYQQSGLEAAAALARQRGILTSQSEVRATLILDTPESDELVNQLGSIGVIVESAYETQVDIAVPMALIQQTGGSGDPGAIFTQLTGLQHVIRVKLPTKTRPGAKVGQVPMLVRWSQDMIHLPGRVTGQGVRVIRADVWQKAGLTGTGVKVGILDCGFKGYKKLLGTELPASIQAKTFVRGLSDPNDSDEAHGTAVAEIIHEVAPEAMLYLADYGCRGASEGRAVEWLLGQDVRIISHSAGSPAAPMDGTGWGAQLVKKAADKGTLWVNSAGNEAESHYRGILADANKNGFHEFKAGQESMAFRSGDSHVEITLRWDDWSKADQDLDLALLDAGGEALAWSRDSQIGAPGDEPLERLEYNDLRVGSVYRLAIYAAQATRAVTFDLTVHSDDVVIEFPTVDYSLISPADARDALATGEVRWDNNRIADYSSHGPTADGRLKPDISAPTTVDNATYGHFGGTSAAAPHVAGAAALVWNAFPSFDRHQVWGYLTGHVVDLGPAGADNAFGAGRLELPDPPALQPETATPEPTGAPTVKPALPTPTLPPASPVATLSPAPALTPSPLPAATPSPTPGAWMELPIPLGWVVGVCGGLVLLLIVAMVARAFRRRQQMPRLPQGPAPHVPPPLPPSYTPTVMRACPHCGRPVRTSARFCAACGKSLLPQSPAPGVAQQNQRCHQCGQTLRPGSKFCAKCGARQ